VANRTPASGYELSIYQSTPTLVWIGLGSRSPSPSLSDSPPPRHPAPTTRRYCSAAVQPSRSSRCRSSAATRFLAAATRSSHVGWARDQRRTLLRTSCSIPGSTRRRWSGRRQGSRYSHRTSTWCCFAFPLVFLLCVPLAVPLIGPAAGVRGRTLRGHAVRSRQQHRRPLQRTCREPKGSSTRRSSSTSRCFTSTAGSVRNASARG